MSWWGCGSTAWCTRTRVNPGSEPNRRQKHIGTGKAGICRIRNREQRDDYEGDNDSPFSHDDLHSTGAGTRCGTIPSCWDQSRPRLWRSAFAIAPGSCLFAIIACRSAPGEHSLNVQKLLLEGDVAVEDAVECAVVDSAADEEHRIGVGLQPPGA